MARGTGATDNGAGWPSRWRPSGSSRPWTSSPAGRSASPSGRGEEQGLFGSRAYVKQHFGYARGPAATARAGGGGGGGRASAPATQSSGRLTDPTEPDGGAGSPATTADHVARRPGRRREGPEFEKLSAYFNLDNGTGKIRGIYLQGNEAARPIFRNWLEPFARPRRRDAHLRTTGGTDHISFDADRPPRLPVHPGPGRVLHRAPTTRTWTSTTGSSPTT